MPTPANNDVLRMDGWPKGANNRLRETEAQAASRNEFEIPSSPWLRSAVNVDLTKDGHPLRRVGYALKSSGFVHSLWSDPRISYGLCVKDGWLTHIDSSGLETPLQEISPYLPVSYTELNGEVYWSNGEALGRVAGKQAKHWGLAVAPEPTVTTTAAGGLFAGTYQVAVSCSDVEGTEHGACESVSVEITTGQGIRVEFGSVPDNAVDYNVYCSQANSEVLYLVATVAVANSQFDIAQPALGRGRQLETAHRQPPRAGQLVRAFSGRVYIARRDTVFFTDPLRYHLTQPSQGIFMFDADVTLLEPVKDGLYVGGDFGVVFISGTDPYNVTQMAVSGSAPVPRAVTRVPGIRMELAADDVPVFWLQDGVMYAGLAGGQLKPLTEDRLAVPTHRLGAMLLREREGMSHVVSVLRQSGEESLLGATDTVVAEIRRGCTKLN